MYHIYKSDFEKLVCTYAISPMNNLTASLGRRRSFCFVEHEQDAYRTVFDSFLGEGAPSAQAKTTPAKEGYPYGRGIHRIKHT